MSSPFTGLTRSSSHPINNGDAEETHYITLDITGVDPSLLSNCASIRLAGLETPTPFLQLGDLVFQGIHAETLGTELVFDDAGGVFTQSERKVLFNPVQLIPKSKTTTETEAETRPGSHDLDTTGSGGAPALAPAARRGRGGRGRARGSRARGKERVQE
ncbi:hypothetical protein RSOLAG1IB_00058 [Rhizoctonia solani AG-1 IB]|uniref:Transcription factor TFIIIC triple barrel domain-containing protein n=1 Tax=Thanatephorus cucumeris (strain AG1-IB / isolate 7/3/14) TaxID=1108050 RepID=A0A0B7F5R4_THACB|nr:hypothetical protein RSOLAG1IB_00058 [Rhizoctonia solani AG-1 IB]